MDALLGIAGLYYLSEISTGHKGGILSWHNGGDLNHVTNHSGKTLYHDTIAGHTIGRPDKYIHHPMRYNDRAPLIRQHTGGHYGRSWLSESGGRGGNDGFHTNAGF